MDPEFDTAILGCYMKLGLERGGGGATFLQGRAVWFSQNTLLSMGLKDFVMTPFAHFTNVTSPF